MALLAAVLGIGAPSIPYAQVMEPLSYTNPPVGLNFLIAGYGYQWGDVLLDPSLPIEDVNGRVNSMTSSYVRTLDFGGQSGTIALIVPYALLSADGKVMGESRSVERSALGDAALRISVNLYGAPALPVQEFRDYRQDTIVGVGMIVTAPTGQYDPERLINIGTNRWSFRPEAGISKALGPWTLETSAGVTFFTDNDEFLKGVPQATGANEREQEPLYGLQGHAIFNFNPKLWAALDANWYTGGRTSVDGEPNDDLQENSRWGATLSRTLNMNNSIKVYFASGVSARTGTNFTTLGIAWQFRWGEGL